MASSTSFSRSWVIGRGVSPPSRAKAIAVASGPLMKMGRVRCWPPTSRSNTIGALLGSSTRTPTSSIWNTSAPYPPSPGSRRPQRGRRSALIALQGIAQQGAAEAVAEVGELVQVLDPLAPRRRVALLHQGQHDLLEEACLTLGGDLVHPQVAGFDAEPPERGCWPCDDERVFVVDGLAAHGSAADQPVAGELGEHLVGAAGGGGELLRREADRAGAGIERMAA